jgi:Uma2 family endonuclease
MVMPAVSPKRWTAQEARELNEKNPLLWPRYEVIDGELLVSPGPRPVHQLAVLELAIRLAAYTKPHRLGQTLTSPADIELEPDSTLQPDVFVVPWAVGHKLRRWSDVTGLLLAVEVLSTSTARYDRVTKRRYFSRNDVPEYWIVDCDGRVFERWRPGDERPEIISERLVWTPLDVTEPFELDVPGFFAEVHGEDVDERSPSD